MALRLVYKISSTVVKPRFFGNSSDCLRRFRSLSPPLRKPKEEECSYSPTRSEDSYDCARRRSHSYPTKSLRRTGSPYNLRENRSLSTERDHDDEEYDNRDESESRKYVHSAKSTPRLQTDKRQKSAFNLPNLQPPPPLQKARSNNAIVLNKKAAQLHQYRLKDSMPEEKKDNVFNVFDYYSEQYKRKASRVMPHLQPHNLKPYGTGENLTFPIDAKRSRPIKYPSTEYGYNESVSKKNQKKGETSDDLNPNYVTSRDFCTKSTSNEQLQKCKKLLEDYKKMNPSYTSSNTKTTLASGSIEEANFLQKTMRLISEYHQQIKSKPSPAPPSKDLEKCNQVISDYKRINPDYQSNKKEIKSGSQDEKDAVNQALNFAANHKKFCTRQRSQTSMFHTKHKVSDQNQDLYEEEIETSVNRGFSLPNIQKLNLPEGSMRVRVGPKANLLQSNALPEAALQWDNLRLGANEKLISPWPSYADHLKNQLAPTKKTTREIIYPDTKITKNSKNMKIQAGYLHPNVELSSRSMHTNINESNCSIQEGTSLNNYHMSLPNLSYFVRGYSSTSKGKMCDKKTVPRKRSKSKDVCDSKFEYPPTPTFSSVDCGCVEPKRPLDVPPLERPPKRCDPKEPPKKCPVIKPCTTPRADAKLKTKPKKLPEITPADDCPCVEIKIKEGCPLKRLKKACIEEPPKICPPCTDIKCTCPPRADEGLKVKRKCLPVLTDKKDCPCIVPKFKDVPPLKPLKKVNIPEPKKFCPVPPVCAIPRADQKLKPKDKTLSKLKPSSCPCVEPRPLKSVILPKLKKGKVEEPPPKVCITIKPCQNPYRSDDKIEPHEKCLPRLRNIKCPCVDPVPPLDVKPLKRPIKRSCPEEPPKICPKKPQLCPSKRADDKLKSQSKKLPCITPAKECPCIEIKMKPGCPLPRLKKPCIKEPPKICPPCKDIKCNCPPRADKNLKIEKKCLPPINIQFCPCINPKVPEDVPPLKQLKKIEIKEPGNTCPPPPDPCPSRADDKMVIKPKQLPKIDASGCKCVEDKPLKDVPLPRLKRNNVCEPSNTCEEVPDPCDQSETDRADEICKYKIKMKKLPPMLLKAEKNHISIRGYKNKKKRRRCGTVNTSHKRRFGMYAKINGTGKGPRLLKMGEKRFSNKSSKNQEPGKNLTSKLKVQELEFDGSKKECKSVSSRADANWKIKKKCLPRLIVKKLPYVDMKKIYSTKKQPQYKRLDWSKLQPSSKEGKPASPSQKEDNDGENNLVGDHGLNRKEMVPLSHLPKLAKTDVKCKEIQEHLPKGLGRTTVNPGTTNMGDNLKTRRRSLPELRLSLHSHEEELDKAERDMPKLKRLFKVQNQEDPAKVYKLQYSNCNTVNERADDLLGYEYKSKKLPPLLPQQLKKGYHTIGRRNSYPLLLSSNDVFNVHQEMINTTPCLLKDKNDKSDKDNCSITKKKPMCPKQKALPTCKSKGRESCEVEFKFKECCKQETPYPSFSDCGEVAEWPKCEGQPTPKLKFLQPQNPIITPPKLMQEMPMEDAAIDLKKEVECALKKLGKKTEGKTKDCENFNKPPKEVTSKDLLGKGKKVKCPGVKKKKSKAKCPKVSVEKCPKKKKKSCGRPTFKTKKTPRQLSSKKKSKSKGKVKCGTKSKIKCNTKTSSKSKRTKSKSSTKGKTKSKTSSKTKSKSSTKVKCSSTKGSTKSKSKCSIKTSSKAKSKSSTKTKSSAKGCTKSKSKCSVKCSTKDKVKSKSSTKLSGKTKTKPSSKEKAKPTKKSSSSKSIEVKKSKSKASLNFAASSGVPAVIVQKKPKGLFSRILSFFSRSEPTPVAKKSSGTLKKTSSKTGSPKKGGSKSKTSVKCAKESKSPKQSKSASKVGSAKDKKECKGTEKPKSVAKPKIKEKKSDNKKDSKIKAQKKGDSKSKASISCKSTKSKSACKSGKSAKPKKSSKPLKGFCEKNKVYKCAAAKKPEKPKGERKCPKFQRTTSKFSKMFPPDMPDCRPKRRRIKRNVKPPPPPKCIPMEAARRSVLDWKMGITKESSACKRTANKCKPKLKTNICKPKSKETKNKRPVFKTKKSKWKSKSKGAACKPKKKKPKCGSKPSVCKPKKKAIKCPPVCKPKKKPSSCGKKTPVCKPKKKKTKPKKCIIKKTPICKPKKKKKKPKKCGSKESSPCKPKKKKAKSEVCPSKPTTTCKPKKKKKPKKCIIKKTPLCKPKKKKAKANKCATKKSSTSGKTSKSKLRKKKGKTKKWGMDKAPICKSKKKKEKTKKCIIKKTPICKPKKKKAKPKKCAAKKSSPCKPKKKKDKTTASKKTSTSKTKRKKTKSKKWGMEKAPICKPKKKKATPKKKKATSKKCKPEKGKKPGSTCKPKRKSKKCKSIKTDCPPKGQKSCEKEFIFKKCKAPEAPYPSFSECRPPFPKPRFSECLVAKKRAKASTEILKKCLERQRVAQGNSKKGKRSYSTLCAIIRARGFHLPTQWRRYYSRKTGRRKNPSILDKTKKDSENKNENMILNQRLLASIEEGIEKLESQDIDLPNNLYYQVLKALQKLTEKEIYEFFDQEAQFNPLLKSDVSETVSFVRKLNPTAEQTLFANNDINFQPRCVGISDPNTLSEEKKTVEAFKSLCKKLCEEADYQDVPYEELERLKTEDMRRQLEELLRQAQNNHK